jgi:hypothetical protein
LYEAEFFAGHHNKRSGITDSRLCEAVRQRSIATVSTGRAPRSGTGDCEAVDSDAVLNDRVTGEFNRDAVEIF